MICPMAGIEIPELYREYMMRDFPKSELKPLDRLMSLHAAGFYDILWERGEDGLCAYACVFSGAPLALLDYYAVVPERRGSGVGSAFLTRLLAAPLLQSGMMVEVEDPDRGTLEERLTRERRIRFYERLGFRDSGVRAVVFGVPFRIYHRGGDERDVYHALVATYRTFVPDEETFAAQIDIKPAP